MKTIVTLLLLLKVVISADAQVLKGKVFGKMEIEKEILPGASVYWLGTTIGATANENGLFAIETSGISDKRLVISFVGFISDTLSITNQTYLTATLIGTKELKQVEVTDKISTAYISSINSIKTEVITQGELKKAACCDLAGCFETQASVQPQTTNVITNSKELRILGLSGVYNQLLFDGMPLFQGLTFTYGISSIPGTLVDNIYVTKGSNSVLQGYESISGQINIIPKHADKTDKLLLNLYTNSFLEKHFNANYSAAIGKRKLWTTLLAFHTVQPAGKFDKDNDYFLDLPLLTRYMGYNQWKYKNENSMGLFSTMSIRYLSEQRIGGQTNFNSSTQKGSVAVYGQTVNYSQPEFSTKTGYRFNENHALVFISSSFYQNQKSYFGTVKYNAEQINGYANLQHEWSWSSKHSVKYGVSFRYQNLEETVAFTANLLDRSFAGSYKTKQIIPGAFAENSFHWKDDKIIWILGARVDNHNDFGSYFTPRSLLKYNLDEANTIRASIGTGWRQVNLFSENINLLVSSRDIVFAEKLQPEKALNWGLNFTHSFEKEKVSGTLSADFYQTQFFNQFFPDYDSDPTKAIVKNFTGKSISNGLQTEANLKLIKVLEFKIAYNFLDVFRIVNGNKYVLPFNPKNRVMSAFSYVSKLDKWQFDVNIHWYDQQRLPTSFLDAIKNQSQKFSKPYTLINSQITHRLKQYEIYVGCENIFNFRQLQPIDGWQNPFGKQFDPTSVWGPTRGREFYAGVKWKVPFSR